MGGLMEAPDRAVVDGQVQFGRFNKPFRELNLLDARCGIPRLFGLRRLRLKEWVHFALIHPDWYLSMAVVDAGFMATSWLHVFDRQKSKAFEHVRKLPPWKFHAPANVLDHSAEFETRGYRVFVHNHVENHMHLLQIEVSAQRSLPSVSGTVTPHEDPARTQPLVAMLPLGPNRPMFTHKSGGPVSGSLEIAGQRVEFTPNRDAGLLDFHKAYYPRQTFWRWATFATIDSSGNLLGVNLTQNVIKDDERFNENCIWHGNSLSLAGAARFDRTRADHRQELAEDYVELIAELTEATGEARAVDLAGRLGVTAATVANAIARLQRDGYVRSEPYRAIFLTERGRALAAYCRRRHRIVLALLAALGVDPATAEQDAEGIEHHVSEPTLAAIERWLARQGITID